MDFATTRSVRALVLSFVFGFLAIAAPGTSLAQYMYLDSNGDGVNTAADVITATGTTTFDVWLRTGKRKDGSVAVCAGDPAPFTINSYEVIVRAVGGTVQYLTRTNLQPTMSLDVSSNIATTSTEAYVGFLGGTILPPGDYRLCRITATVLSGTPNLTIVPLATTLAVSFPRRTEFGSQCLGFDFDNTLKLGSDWFDTDGLTFSSGTVSNVPPSISAISPITVASGETASEDVYATDSNGDIVTLSLSVAGRTPTLTALDINTGSSRSRIHARPLRSEVGMISAQVVASDGIDQTIAPVEVTISSGPNHPPTVSGPTRVRVIGGTTASVALRAQDPDGDAVALSKESGPAFATVLESARGIASTTGQLIMRPTVCDIGSWSIVVRGSSFDGSSTVTISVDVVPAISPGPPPSLPPTESTGLAAADFDGDGNLDLAAAEESSVGYLTILKGNGAGAFVSIGRYLLGLSYVAVETGDWNADGKQDVAAGSFSAGTLKVFYGNGDGTFGTPVEYADIPQARNLRRADFNRDGIDDLAAASGGSQPAILLGGTSGLGLASRIPLGSISQDVSIDDFDMDGIDDLVFSCIAPRRLMVYFGRGDGTFGSPLTIPTIYPPFGVLATDTNEDGKADIVVAEAFGPRLFVYRGDGAGGFGPEVVLINSPGVQYGSCVIDGDWNADGHTDIYSTVEDGPGAIHFGRGDGAFSSSPITTGYGFQATFADLNSDGRPDLAVGGGVVYVLLNQTPFPTSATGRVFQENSKKPIPTNPSSATLCLRLEPVAGAFALQDIDPLSMRLSSAGTGSVSSISARSPKSGVIGDADGNGADELPVCFAMTDVSNLFSLLRGKQTVPVVVDGALLDGRRFCSRADLTIIGKGSAGTAARVEPNPLNPEGTLRFVTKTPGAVSVRLFDVNGRLVKTVWNARTTAVGEQEVRIDGKDAVGRSLRSGVYFYRIDGAGADETGRFTILK